MSEFNKSYLSSSNVSYVDKGTNLTYLDITENPTSVTYASSKDKAIENDVKDIELDNNNIISTSSAVQLNSKFYKKSHHLVFSQINLSTKEYDLMALLFSRIQKAHWKYYQEHENVKFTPRYKFSNQVLSDWFGVDSSQLYSLLKGPSKTLSSKPVGILNENKKGFDFVSLFKRITYDNGELIMSPNDELSDEWLTVAGGHAQVDHVIFRKLTRRYSKALYEILSRFKTSGKGKLNILSLKDLYAGFGLLNADGEVSKKSYEKNQMFMENCIRRSISEIDKTEKNITFYNSTQRKNCYGYNIISGGRGGKIKGLEFLFSWKQKEVESVSELFDRLGNRKEYTDAIGVYMVVNRDDFTPDNPINPTFEELTMMISQPEVLLQHGLELSSEFMSKYSTSMAEAQKHKLAKLNEYKP